MAKEIQIPAFGWKPHSYQLSLWRAFQASEYKDFRGVIVWPRRAGKDATCLQLMLQSALNKAAVYWYLFPSYSQVRKGVWSAVNPMTNRRIIDEVIPKNIRKKTLDQQMMIELINGSIIQFLGSDNTESSLVGAPPYGIVMSEYAISTPSAYGFLMPILAQNHGWLLVNSTPRGRNHFFKLYEMARYNRRWFSERLTVEDIPDFDMNIVDEQREEYYSLYGKEQGESLIQQEYFTSFNAVIVGSVYGSFMESVEKGNRISDDIVALSDHPIHAVIDIGVSDMMAVIVFQVFHDRIHILDYYENSSQGFDHYYDWLEKSGYHKGTIYVPHDAKKREPTDTGLRTRIDSLVSLGLHPQLVPNMGVADGIQAARLTLPRCYFNKSKTERLVECLVHYSYDWDEKNSVFKETPKHDWSSHAADAFRYLSLSWKIPKAKPVEEKKVNLPITQITYNDLWEDYENRREVTRRI